MISKKTKKLMIPGPVEVHPDVLRALAEPVEPHYGDAWVEKYQRVLSLLAEVFNTKGDIFLMMGSGSCAIDAAIGSSLLTGEKIIVGNNGFFGDRLVSIARRNGLKVVEVAGEWGKKLDPQDFSKAFKKHPDAKGVAVVHSETSTTVINPVEEIGPIARKHDAVFIVDAVSALGGLPYDMGAWCIDICATASQKCLGAPPGLAPIAITKRAWEFINRVETNAHGWYTDLRVWRKYSIDWADWHPTPVTMATNIVNALLVALEQLMKEGIVNRMERYRRLALQLREGMRAAGMPPFTPDEELNPVLTAGYSPKGIPSSEVVKYLFEKYNIQISGGLGELKQKVFRIGHMSPIITEQDISLVCNALNAFGK
ncbi:MAG TPA: alanine--glyoxylate aminotransferase family protein [Anaerolineae bacterium]|nr:alanine--glyoxylate aminotransferase family protein [Anaerolineae bacterium]